MKRFIFLFISYLLFSGISFAQEVTYDIVDDIIEDIEAENNDEGVVTDNNDVPQEIEGEPIVFETDKKSEKNVYKLKINKYANPNLKKEPLKIYSEERFLSQKFAQRHDIDKTLALPPLKLYKGSVKSGGNYSANYLNPNGEKTIGIFTEYKYKKFTLNTEYTSSSNRNISNYSEKIKFTPSYNFTDSFTIKYIYNQDVQKDSYQGGIGFSYKPKKFLSNMEFSADVRNKMSEQKDSSYQLNFETKLRW